MNNKTFNIIDFGAIGDGKTDCTAAIQAALDKAAVAGGTVLVPPGDYLTGKVKMRGLGVCLKGDSAWGFGSDGTATFILNSADVDCMIDITGAFGCTIHGICMNGKGLGENIHGVNLYWPEYNGGGKEDTPTIEDCRIGYFTGDGLHFEHVWCFSLRHSMLCHNKGCGLYIDGWDAFIIDNWFTDNANAGLNGKVIASITCTGNRVEWNRRGGFVIPCGDSCNITGNFFDRTFGPAIELGTDDGGIVDLVTVTGNIFRRGGAYENGIIPEDKGMLSHISLKNCTGVVINGNTMRVGMNDDKTGALSPDYGFVLSNCKNTIISDNTMNNGVMKKLFVFNCEQDESCVIKNNIGNVVVD